MHYLFIDVVHLIWSGDEEMVFELRSKLLKYYSCPQTKCLYYVSWQLLILMCNFQIPDLIKSRNIWNIDDFLGPSCSGHLSRLLNSENFYNPDFFARPTYVWILEVTLYYCTYLTFLKTFLIKVPYKVWLFACVKTLFSLQLKTGCTDSSVLHSN